MRKQNTAETTNDFRGFNNQKGEPGNKKRKMF
jgi:rRNA-processing protein EBP2